MKITLPLRAEDIAKMKAGDEVYLTGTIYSARDQAHKRLFELLEKGEDFPVDLKGQTVFYMGPAPTPDGKIIGSCGPTTAYRMDPFAPALMDYGLKGMIGKGPRAQEVADSVVRNKGVYFYAYGGCGALYAQKIKANELAAFGDLGPEAIYKLEVEDFPVVVAIDSEGGNIYG
ncbi:fumarate hydratase subunit beta [Spirochaeta isovalerica]|uniref:Fumarate hydratase subunit beta n=1 Tax=Spirochaeta isovalerica TaxID=150 RepID=A0A841R8W8_9SPIO|nr:fumarate hydratase subunit beta [Spirochaeta isovalerica]